MRGGTGSPFATRRSSIMARSASAMEKAPNRWPAPCGRKRLGRPHHPLGRALPAGGQRLHRLLPEHARRRPLLAQRHEVAPQPGLELPRPGALEGCSGYRRGYAGGGNTSSRYSSIAEDSASQRSPCCSEGRGQSPSATGSRRGGAPRRRGRRCAARRGGSSPSAHPAREDVWAVAVLVAPQHQLVVGHVVRPSEACPMIVFTMSCWSVGR